MSGINIDLVNGQSQQIAVGAVSAQSAPLPAATAVVYATVDCFVRQGDNPVALATGVDQFIPAGGWVRLNGLTPGYKLAFISAGGAGSVYLSPGAAYGWR